MAPKRDKDRNDENYWRMYIEEAVLNEDNWRVKVVVLETTGNEQEALYLNKFETYAQQEKRFVIKNICKSETMFMINQLGGEKKVKDEYMRVFEEGYMYIKEKKDVAPDVLALIIKYLILKMKEDYMFVQHQKLVVKEGMQKESFTMIDRAEVKNNKSGQVVTPVETEKSSPTKSKEKKGESEPVHLSPLIDEGNEGKKYGTLLRMRGEEWRDKIYVDDYPLDGPNLYVAITGFIEPYLVENLMKIGVAVTAIVQIKIDPIYNEISSGLSAGTKRGHSATQLTIEKSCTFWETLQRLRLSKSSADLYKNMAFIVFTPPYRNNETLSNSSEKIYDDLSYLIYDIQDLTRQHIHYLNSMDIKYIPTESKNEYILRYYYHYMDKIPLECVNIFSILQSMLQTVCVSHPNNQTTSRSSLSTASTLIESRIKNQNNYEMAETLTTEVFKTLSKHNLYKRKYRVTCGEEYDNFKEPVVIKYGDSIKCTTFHLENTDLEDIVRSSLIHMPICNLWKNHTYPSENSKAKVNFHLDALLSCFDRDKVNDSMLNRLIHILSCRKLYNNRSSLKEHHIPSITIPEFKRKYLKRSILAEPIPKSHSLLCTSSTSSPPTPTLVRSESYSKVLSNRSDSEIQNVKLLFNCPDLSELISATEILNNEPLEHLIDNYDYFEDFSDTSALLVLHEAFTKFNCLNYKYCEVTDSFVFMFYNNHDSDGILYDEWRCHLVTPVCLQDFFDYVLEEQFKWIQDEEKIHDKSIALGIKLEYNESMEQVTAKSCLENFELESELLIKGSIKYHERADVDYLTNENIESDEFSIKNNSLSTRSTTADRKSNRPEKTLAQNSKKRVTETVGDSNLDVVSDNQTKVKPFFGYNLGDRRFEFFGKDSTYFSKDGTKVCINYTVTVPLNTEHIILKIIPGNCNTEFVMHKSLGDVTQSQSGNTCESFRIIRKDQVLFYIRKNWNKTPTLTFDASSFIKPEIKESINKINMSTNSGMNAYFNELIFYSFSITWPNGLIVESVHENNSQAISHIKQFFISSKAHSDEDMRCISSNGEVIVFKKSGIIEVFRPDGTCHKITKYGKRLLYPNIINDSRTTISSDKVNKRKDKSKLKLKRSTKSSKNVIDRNEILPEKEHLSYNLFIEDFETIDSSGLKHTWESDSLIATEKLLVRTATDYYLGEVLSRRMDGTEMLLNEDWVLVVSFPDDTKITTTCFIENEEIYPDCLEPDHGLINTHVFESDLKSNDLLSDKSFTSRGTSNSLNSNDSSKVDQRKSNNRTDGYVSVQVRHIIEHTNFATITIDKASEKITIESPNKTSLSIDNANQYAFSLDESTFATFDGEYLDIKFDASSMCESSTNCRVKINNTENKKDQTWLSMNDSFYKKIVIDEEGTIKLVDELNKKDKNQARGATYPNAKDSNIISDNNATPRGKCKEIFDANMLRFFVFNRDLTCSELVHRDLVDQYKDHYRKQPWCFINHYDTFGDCRCLLSFLTPIQLTETEKWLMPSKYTYMPKQLKYKDLRTDIGKGFYHWMRPYERFEPTPTTLDNLTLPRLPRAYILRTLEQLWGEEMREQLKGAKELVRAVLGYCRLMESECQKILEVPIRDPRPVEERCIDEKLQDIAQRAAALQFAHKLISNSERTENKSLKNSSDNKTNSESVPTDINAPTTSSGLTTTDKSKNEDLREKTPMSKTLSFINENIPSISTPEKNKVKKQILQLNVISASLQTAYEKHDNKSKQILKGIISSEAVEKYNLKTDISKSLGLKGRVRKFKKKERTYKEAKEIRIFFNRDDNIRMTAGKKECFGRGNDKLQKRFLLTSLKKLYTKYVSEGGKASFSTFRKNRPRNVVRPKLSDRNTVACIKHSSLAFKVAHLKKIGVIDTSDLQELLASSVCSVESYDCMYLNCGKCKDNNPEMNLIDITNNTECTSIQWIRKEFTFEKGIERKITTTKKYVKESIKGTFSELKEMFLADLRAFRQHFFNNQIPNDLDPVPLTTRLHQITYHVPSTTLRMYEDLKSQLADDIQSRAKPTITTKAPTPRQKSAKSDTDEVTCEDLKRSLQEKQAEYLREVEEIVQPSPNLKRYWRRRAEEKKEEEFYKKLLREEYVPPYFRNVLGGAAWWDLNQAAGDAVAIAEQNACGCLFRGDPSGAATTTDYIGE
ncbi:unnamed protein product [Parnassius apollo]|uniref:(apollo) hypothetical protein n=1 Tax=Parnassius apollo TaxID=110799 RepID=A0A8S3VXZ4_PARAO|nr:unnamed protein product [Parnassius apollo]